ncbi:RHS repeat-associated core domain-containing protein [Bacteroides caccae]|uniref:RHS repeat-associated core domain-containing protein n=5 Tax=Bacteroides caccae TaxID=47678 RepID=UPI001F274B93|nr:RHS repeat-associated core domain-containing protein [Bacteroides caccae]MDC7282632.1 RHS repeat-associated core domain-containing protein [Bacteroides caccae]UWN79090.1 RHS repeat-associated core domain-containing protein [Bacteroides caccae]
MNIKRIIVLVLISASSGLLCAQRKTVNMSDRYGILTVTPLDKYTGAASLLKTNGVRSLTDVSYGDGFGGVSQKIHVGITPQGKDLTESYEYNSLGNLQSRTLPVPVLSEGASGNYKQILKSAQEYYGHSNVCSRFAYEASHRSLLLKEFGVGDEWTGKAVSKKYSCNLESIPVQRCKRYLVSDGGELVESDSPYADGSLRGIRSEDEDGNMHWEFYNSENQLVLSRILDGDTFFDTYFVYDEYGNLVFVLPPGYQDHPDLDLYAYIYRYDYLDRLVYKKLPGCAPSYLVYDAAHRLVFSQDGCQRNDSLWSFFVYDVYGRVVVEGECSNSDKHVRTAGETVVLGTLMEGDTGLAYSGYQSSFDLVDPCVYVVNYYDTYDFRTRNGFSAYNFPEGTVSATGNLTGSILCTHGSSGFIYSADYYDINKRIVKSLSSRVNGGMDTYATEYSFQGRPLSVLHTHTDSSGYSLTERYTYTYDHSSRLTRVSHQYDNNPSVLLLEHAYDELGRLQTDKLDNGIYATDYAYNIRNWLTGIEGGKFSQSLHYTDGLGVPCYNGNISSMTWKSGAGATPRGYKFSYDRLGRLTDAEYGEGPSFSVNTNRFNEQVTGYDKMGNILGLKRYGQTSATGYDVIDDLSLSYAGNRLKKVTDRSTTPAFNNGFEFKDGIDLPTEYEYDENGNLTKDLNKNITAIQYNCLNLPSRVMFANGDSISYLYDAAGRKLRTVHVLEGDSVTTDYCGNVVYENGVPQILLTEVGYVSLTDGKYHYYLKDHQGNNRVVVDEEGTVEEVNHYYPFGGVFSSTGDAQPYKYNGKELDRKGGLDWYDYGARMYDAALGRFMKTDRFSEKYVSLSPYQYGANNPVNNIDVNGDSITVLNYGYIRKQHMAILIQNDAGEWQYFSVNGDNVYVSGEFSGGRKFNDIAVGEFDSPQEFLNSPYNSYGASDDMSINTYGFSEGYMIPTSKEQDDIIRDTFISISKNESYDFLGNNCSTVVQKSLEAAGIITFTQKSTRHRIPSSHYLGESSFIATISTSRPVIPSVSFRAIIKNNPQGKMIYR